MDDSEDPITEGFLRKNTYLGEAPKHLGSQPGCLRGMTVAVHTQGGSVETVKTQWCGMLLSPELAT